MYFFDYGNTPPNILIEIARWTAPLATVSGLLLIISSARRWVKRKISQLHKNNVAIYFGFENERNELIQQLKGIHFKGFEGGDKLVKAKRYILLGDDSINLSFFSQNYDYLRERYVYIKSAEISDSSIGGEKVIFFNPEEIAARKYWKEYCLYDDFLQHNGDIIVVFIGYSKIGEELLKWALLDNVFDTQGKQHIEYHLFGDYSEFIAVHNNIKLIEDLVIVHEEPWFEDVRLLKSASRIILLNQEEQFRIIEELIICLNSPNLHIFSSSCTSNFLIGEYRDNILFYDWIKEGFDVKSIFNDDIFFQAKCINYYYSVRYSDSYCGEMSDEKAFDAVKKASHSDLNDAWTHTAGTAFLRYSNVSAADYHDIRLMLMKKLCFPSKYEDLFSTQVEFLAELEHIRWCRYHFLNNWEYGNDFSGTKNVEQRKHKLLIPYAELKEEDKEKDRNNLNVLLGLETFTD